MSSNRKTIWKIALFGGRKRPAQAYEVRITDVDGHVTRGHGRDPLEAHRAAEIKLVVKPWICASDIGRLEEYKDDYEKLAERCKKFESMLADVEILANKVLQGRLGYTAGINGIAALFKQEKDGTGAAS